MHQIGLKLWSTNENYFEEAKRLFEEGVYEYIELYTVPQSQHFLDLWKQLCVPYVIHAPHYGSGMNLADRSKEKENMDLAMQAIRYADVLNAQFIIFHPGVEGCIEETVRQLRNVTDPRMLIENKPHLGLGEFICVGSRPQEIALAMQECRIGCCLDIGHAVCAANFFQKDAVEFVKEFMHLNPAMFHLSDGDWNGKYDSHRHLGEGSYRFDQLLNLLPPKSMVTVETDKNCAGSLNDFVNDVKRLILWT